MLKYQNNLDSYSTGNFNLSLEQWSILNKSAAFLKNGASQNNSRNTQKIANLGTGPPFKHYYCRFKTESDNKISFFWSLNLVGRYITTRAI